MVRHQHSDIIIVGAGPSSVYLLYFISELTLKPCKITILEASDSEGEGKPFSIKGAYPNLLSNLSLKELPVFDRFKYTSLNQAEIFEDTSSEVCARENIGKYYQRTFVRLQQKLRDKGHKIAVHKHTPVQKIKVFSKGYALWTKAGDIHNASTVVLNVGNSLNTRSVKPGHFKPYPSFIYSELPVSQFRIIGASLSAIDAILSIAQQRGNFQVSLPNLQYVANTPFRIELLSTSGQFPQPFYSTLQESTYLHYLQQRFVHINGAPCQFVQRAFFALLEHFDPYTFNQIRVMSLEQALEFLLGRRAWVNPFQKLQIESFAAHFAQLRGVNWPAMLEASLAHCETMRAKGSRATAFKGKLKQYLRACMASIPSENVKKLTALHQAGILSLTKKTLENETSNDTEQQEPLHNASTVTIDARGHVDATKGLLRLSQSIELSRNATPLPHATSVEHIDVSNNQRLVVNHMETDIYIGSGFLTPHLLRLPGLDTCNTIAKTICQSIFALPAEEKQTG